jgi:hypothetical protein
MRSHPTACFGYAVSSGPSYNLAPNGLHFFVRNTKTRGGAKRVPPSLVSLERVRAMSVKQGKQHNGLGSRGHDSVRLIGLVRSDVSSERSGWALRRARLNHRSLHPLPRMDYVLIEITRNIHTHATSTFHLLVLMQA